MSTEEISPLPPTPLTLSHYIAALISLLGAAQPSMLARMRLIVGDRRARIVLDDEAVEVAFDREGLKVLPMTGNPELSGEGATDTATVLELLDGYLEVSDAILSGRLRVFGEAEDIIRMFMAIEILLDAAPRTPALQSLASKFRSDRREWRGPVVPEMDRVSWYPFSPDVSELELLDRLDLLPNSSLDADV
jgi:hypothetical protein